jgi:hypothetical protein
MWIELQDGDRYTAGEGHPNFMVAVASLCWRLRLGRLSWWIADVCFVLHRMKRTGPHREVYGAALLLLGYLPFSKDTQIRLNNRRNMLLYGC